MRVATIISLGASAVLGVGALFVARVWLPDSDSGARGPAAKPVEVPVVVASVPLKYGTKLERKHLALTRVPANAAPVGAYASIDALLSAQGGAPVVLVPLSTREPILPTKVSGPGSRPSVAAQISDGKRAYTIRVTDVAGVGGHALPGDYVDVILTRDMSVDRDERRFASDVVIQNVRVLGIDLNADPTSNAPMTPKNATLEVAVEDAQKLAVAADLGNLSLALRRAGSAELAPVRRVAANEFGAVARRPILQAAAPSAPSAQPRQVAEPRWGRRMVVVHGDAVAEVSVRPEWPGGA